MQNLNHAYLNLVVTQNYKLNRERQVLNNESGSKTFKCDDWLLQLKYKSNYQFSRRCRELLILFERLNSIGKYSQGSNVKHASTKESKQTQKLTQTQRSVSSWTLRQLPNVEEKKEKENSWRERKFSTYCIKIVCMNVHTILIHSENSKCIYEYI